MAIVDAERTLVSLDQATLADGSHSLEVGEFQRPRCEAHPAHARPHRSRTHEHHLATRCEQGIKLAAERIDAGSIEEAVGAREHAGSNLDNDQCGSGGNILADLIRHVGHGEMARGIRAVGVHNGDPNSHPAVTRKTP